MDKNKTADELRKRGYDCSVDSGVVMIKGHKDSQLLSALKKDINELAYTGSFGIHMARTGSKPKDGNSDAEMTDEEAEPTEEEIARDIITFDGNESQEPGIDYDESDGQGTFNF